MTSTDLLNQQKAATGVLAAIPDVTAYRSCTESELLALAAENAQASRLLSTHGARIAGEIARRSTPELGSAGLAQKQGERTPENLVRRITGSTKWEANTAVRIGKLGTDSIETVDVATGEVAPPKEPWLTSLVAALSAGQVSVAQADAIRTGLGQPSEHVTVERLAEQVELLVVLAGSHDADWLSREARHLRDLIDAQGVAERERLHYLKRSWKLIGRADGSGYSLIEHDAVSYAKMRDIYDRVTSPRRGGPRFVDPERQAQAAAVEEDERSTENIAHDAIMDFIEAGTHVDETVMLGRGGAQVRVIVTKEALEAAKSTDTTDAADATATDATGGADGTAATDGADGVDSTTATECTETVTPRVPGYGYIEGQPNPVSIGTIEAMVCDGEVVPVIFDATGQAIDIGQKHRLFSIKQRIFLAVMFGGCMFGDCTRPAAWCEAHHIKQVHRDGGTSVLDNGILLCRHHHLLLHNNGWEITRTGDKGEHYWLIPPPDIDPEQTPRPMRRKSAAYRERYPALA